jgi:hypothetical protein
MALGLILLGSRGCDEKKWSTDCMVGRGIIEKPEQELNVKIVIYFQVLKMTISFAEVREIDFLK